jgi:hypothetical protein
VMVLTGGSLYAERQDRWNVDMVRWPVLASTVLVLTPLLMLIPWLVHARKAAPAGFWGLKFWLLCCAVSVLLTVAGIMNASSTTLATRNVWTTAIFAGSILLPASGVLSFMFTVDAVLGAAGKWLRAYAVLVSVAALIVSGYLSAWGMLGFRTWSY